MEDALVIEMLCRRYPAYTPETAAQAPPWVLSHIAILQSVMGEGA